MSKSNDKSLFAGLIDRVWRNPWANVRAGIKKACDDMPPRQRLMVVTELLLAFVLIAFVAFGHACYKIGARQASNQIEVEHIYNMELPKSNVEDKMKAYDEEAFKRSYEYEVLDSCEQITDSAYDVAGMENED